MATISNTPRPGYVWDSTDNVWYPIGVGGHSHGEIPATIADAKGDLIVGTAADTVDRLAVGNNGETLVADSAATTGLRYSAVANQNLLINGSLDIWQRGTSFTANNVYTADRWFIYSNSNGSVAQETSVIPDGATYALKMATTAGSSYINMQQALEQSDVEKLAGKTITFSVYLRANATYNGSFGVVVNSSTTGNSQTPTWTLVGQTLHTPSTSAYTRVSVTVTVPTTAKGLSFQVSQQSVLASGSIYYMALPKVELGSVATPFVRYGGTIQGELAAAQRYFSRFISGASKVGAMATASSTTSAFFVIPLIVEMRSAPSLTVSAASHFGYSGVANTNVITLNPTQTTSKVALVDATIASASLVTRSGYLFVSDSASATFDLSAEL